MIMILEEMMADIVIDQFQESDFPVALPWPDFININRSYLEPGHNAIRRNLDCPLNPADRLCEIDPVDEGPMDKPASWNGPNEFGGEICHAHRDGTTHVVLHPEDVMIVLQSGYGDG